MGRQKLASKLGFVMLFCALLRTPNAAGEEVTIYRDQLGDAHVYAETVAGAAFGVGYAQADDDLEQLLINYRRASGTMAEVAGPEMSPSDYRARLWQHATVARQRFTAIAPEVQEICRAFVAGVSLFMQRNPQRVPPWSPSIEPADPLALGRLIISQWIEYQAAADLLRAGIQLPASPMSDSAARAILPQESPGTGAVALVDMPRMHGGPAGCFPITLVASRDGIAASGTTLPGMPLPLVGHSQHACWAMSAPTADSADIYQETINPANRLEYRLDGQWHAIGQRRETILVQLAAGIVAREVSISSTHRGPIVARRGSTAFSVASPYVDRVGLLEELFGLMTARNLGQIKEVLAGCELMPQRQLVVTADREIYTTDVGSVPIRDHSYPTDRPISGAHSANDYTGIHRHAELSQAVYSAAAGVAAERILPAGTAAIDLIRQGEAQRATGARGRRAGGRSARQMVVLARPPQSFRVLSADSDHSADLAPGSSDVEQLVKSGRLVDGRFLDRSGIEAESPRAIRLEFTPSGG